MEVLARGPGSLKTGVHLAAGGWTSEQGATQMKRDVVPLHPKVIVVYYGWNDHWVALGPTDEELHDAHQYLWIADHLRLAQLVLKVRVGVAQRRRERPNRVPPERYRANLEEIAMLAHGAGTTTIFVTAPSNYVAEHEPEYLLRRHVQRLADVIPLHQEYLELTRVAARNSGAFLCDAATEFAALPGSHDPLFRADAIHFTSQGDQQLAQIVSGCIIHATERPPQ